MRVPSRTVTLLPSPRAWGTLPLIFQEKGNGVSPLPMKKLLPVASTMEGSTTGLALPVIVTRLATSRASPNESKPGPRFAVVPGTDTVTEEAGFVFVVTLLMSTKSIPPSVETINIWLEGLSRVPARALEDGLTPIVVPLIAACNSTMLNGGEGGIRTLGTLLEYGALAKRCFRPLSHLTSCSLSPC